MGRDSFERVKSLTNTLRHQLLCIEILTCSILSCPILKNPVQNCAQTPMEKSIFLSCLALSATLSCSAPAQTTAPDKRVMVEVKIKDGPWKSYPTQTLETLPGYTPVAAPIETDIYGGWPQIKSKATGFFYATKIGKRFWLIDPLGNGFIRKAIVVVSPGVSDGMKASFETKFGSDAKWADATTQMLWNAGFNGVGAWSSNDLLRAAPRPVVTTKIWNFMGTYSRKRGSTDTGAGHLNYPKGAIPVFDPAFETFCDEHAKQLTTTKNDPYLLGHFSDNELPWPKNSLELFLALPADDPGHVAALKWKKANVKGKISAADNDAFRGVVAERYFSIVSKAIKKYDPNHLFLGARLHGQYLDAESVVKTASKYVDVMSANYYGRWTPERERMNKWVTWTGKPFIITEWYAKGDDTDMENLAGAGWTVRTQKDRGLFYQNFALGLLENPGCVGWHWFKYMDNDATDPKLAVNYRAANQGIVSPAYQPYNALLDEMRALNDNVYPLAQYFDAQSLNFNASNLRRFAVPSNG